MSFPRAIFSMDTMTPRRNTGDGGGNESRQLLTPMSQVYGTTMNDRAVAAEQEEYNETHQRHRYQGNNSNNNNNNNNNETTSLNNRGREGENDSSNGEDGNDEGDQQTRDRNGQAGRGNENDEEHGEEDDDPNDRDATIERLTRRLRCLFSAITWPIVPLGTLVSFNLLWVLYAAFVLDARRTCSHPLHAYALASLLFLIYAPYHAQVRAYLFRYSRERDGPVRPTRVRLYDQLFHTLCILYVYGGVTLIQTCQGDIPSPTSSGSSNNSTATSSSTIPTSPPASALMSPQNTCQTTCPRLYPALDLYVTALELFTLSLILPLLFLPCIYLWILRRASSDAEALLQDSLEEEDLFGTGRRQRGNTVSAQEIMETLEPVKLTQNSSTGQYMVLSDRTGQSTSAGDEMLECCICMTEFQLSTTNSTTNDEEEGAAAPPLSPDGDEMVRTKCGHMFHRKCLAGWIGGRWDPSDSRRRRARRTGCPLCREDLRPDASSRTLDAPNSSV